MEYWRSIKSASGYKDNKSPDSNFTFFEVVIALKMNRHY
ncbi:hypothetical protein ADIWIN_0532 [Winogradskyella psychrotolerans RS-3]|uniref:Uncharacterized protein n=1 Tax=Winogradskyella psychrotolerans RS-3 TaxID=641526 RepID=S7VWD8_9FLAO|nr:hypothetical protein ADIWIN_0532 [Winogradskyella psychrotolerans RS-3]